MSEVRDLTRTEVALLRCLQKRTRHTGERILVYQTNRQFWRPGGRTGPGWNPATFHALVRARLAAYHRGDYGGTFISLTPEGIRT